MKTFESFLQEAHFAENPHLLDDMLPDAFNEWLNEEIDAETIMMYAKMWARELLNNVVKDIK